MIVLRIVSTHQRLLIKLERLDNFIDTEFLAPFLGLGEHEVSFDHIEFTSPEETELHVSDFLIQVGVQE
jgi:hypothetical protein